MRKIMIATAIGLPLLAGAAFLAVSNAPAAGPAKLASAHAADCCPTSGASTKADDCCTESDAPAKTAVAEDGCCDGGSCCH